LNRVYHFFRFREQKYKKNLFFLLTTNKK
jgi:hypothetical protein